MKQNSYKRLAMAEAMANMQKAELVETLTAAYEAACTDRNEEAAAALARKIRNKLLDETDKQMALDRLGLTVPSGTAFTEWLSFLRGLGEVLVGSWAQYRQALRDLPEQEGFPFEIKFPVSPDGEENVVE